MYTAIYSYGLVGIVAMLSVSWFMIPYVVRWFEVRYLAELCREHRLIVLSFDDGPSDGLTPAVADLLRTLDITASFFFVGQRALQSPDVVGRIVAEGHEVGSHTARHLNAWKSAPVAHCRDMLNGHRQVTSLVGPTPLFRPPYGKMSLASFMLARMKRLSLAWWTIDARDSLARPRSHDDVLDRISAAGGGVVLLHDWDRFPDPDHRGYVLGLIRKIAALARENELRFANFSDLRGLVTAPLGARSRPSPLQP